MLSLVNSKRTVFFSWIRYILLTVKGYFFQLNTLRLHNSKRTVFFQLNKLSLVNSKRTVFCGCVFWGRRQWLSTTFYPFYVLVIFILFTITPTPYSTIYLHIRCFSTNLLFSARLVSAKFAELYFLIIYPSNWQLFMFLNISDLFDSIFIKTSTQVNWFFSFCVCHCRESH